MANLDAYLAQRARTPFAYFEHDCARLAADWVLEKTGTDPLAPLRSAGGPLAPKRLLTALRYVRAQGGFIQAGEALLGTSCLGLLARRGDVVLARSGGRIGRVSGYSFGVCTGSHIAAPGTDRIEFLPLSEGVAAWRV